MIPAGDGQSELVPPVAVTANDAGAANLIAGWVAGRPELALRCCLDGPAREIFAREAIRFVPASPTDVLDGARTLLSGTSGTWCSLEHGSRILARKLGIRSIAAVDHWVNYPVRFIRGGEMVLPDELWVGDEMALAEARRAFPGLPVFQRPNHYLERMVDSIQAVPKTSSATTRILYVLETVRSSWGLAGTPGEFRALNHFFQNIHTLIGGGAVEIRLRPHPSDPPGKYDEWVHRGGPYPVSMDTTASLTDSIAWADCVVGCETFAMVVALKAGRRVYTSLPPDSPPCRLPFPDIRRLTSV